MKKLPYLQLCSTNVLSIVFALLASFFVHQSFSFSNHNAGEKQAVVTKILNNVDADFCSTDPIKKIRKVVIDAGHGGKDHGCSGHHSKEKDIVLKIVKKFGRMMREIHPEVELMYTRESDVFIPLHRRIELANQNDADLFISIHCNHFSHNQTNGTETYVMGLHKAEENLEVAKRENASVLYEKDFKDTYDGYNPNSSEGHIILSAFQNAHLQQSIELADKIEKSFGKRTLLKSRGVKQAGFVVLRRATMPSVLVEAGFLSNRKDEEYLNSDDGQEFVSHALVTAFTEYKRDLEGDYIQTHFVSNTEANKTIEETAPPAHKIEKVKNTTQVTHAVAVVETATVIKSENKAVISKPAHTNKNKVFTPVPNKVKTKKVIKNQLAYRVQIAASRNKPITNRTDQWNQVEDLEIREEENMYKYLTGYFYDLSQAIEYKEKMRNLGFKGAFVVGYQGENRVNI